ncbi:Hypothetical predicted protein [Olea europaea subsp. europaea]|uniref:Uncharacterized protein n=1 Tax=Olea europaea subsp. europaea TaxID=158383 RepID=A0A8S0PM92_OLEEU|nr:Hypothetical predicted protein [Olea europaea subsp. europaea]
MSGMRLGLGRDTSQFLGTRRYHGVLAMSEKQAHCRHSGQFLGHCVQAMFGMRPDRDREVAYFLRISRPYPVRRPCPGPRQISQHFLIVYGTRFIGHVQDSSWPRRGRRLFFRHMKAARCVGHVRDARTLPGISWLFQGYDVQAMHRTRPGHSSEAA